MITKPTTLKIGSYSHGTLREEDLISTFLDVARGLRLTGRERSLVTAIGRRFITMTSFPKLAEEYFSTDSTDDLDALLDILNSHVPDFCHFGTHEGDGSDFGVWVSSEVFEDQDEIYKSSDCPGNDPEAGRGLPYWLQVNDHGNATLFRRSGNRWREVWAIV